MKNGGNSVRFGLDDTDRFVIAAMCLFVAVIGLMVLAVTWSGDGVVAVRQRSHVPQHILDGLVPSQEYPKMALSRTEERRVLRQRLMRDCARQQSEHECVVTVARAVDLALPRGGQ